MIGFRYSYFAFISWRPETILLSDQVVLAGVLNELYELHLPLLTAESLWSYMTI